MRKGSERFHAAEDLYAVVCLEQHGIGGCAQDRAGYSRSNVAYGKYVRILPGDSTDLHAAGGFTIKFTGIDNVYIRSRSHSSFEIYRGGGK